jgi:hypothetical protein
MAIGGLCENCDFSIPDRGLQHLSIRDLPDRPSCNNNLLCAVIRPAGFCGALCSRRIIRRPIVEPPAESGGSWWQESTWQNLYWRIQFE